MQTIFRRIGVAAVLACALAPASAQAAPGCGGTITASTTLRGDLTGCPGDGLVIGADNLTLDLGRHTIAGSGAAGSAGIRLAGHHGVTIRNGTVRDFATGVALTDAARNRVHGSSCRTTRAVRSTRPARTATCSTASSPRATPQGSR